MREVARKVWLKRKEGGGKKEKESREGGEEGEEKEVEEEGKGGGGKGMIHPPKGEFHHLATCYSFTHLYYWCVQCAFSVHNQPWEHKP